MGNIVPGLFSLPDFDPAANDGKPPSIVSFSGAGGAPGQLPMSLQVSRGTSVRLSWQISGAVDALSLDGATRDLAAGATGLTVKPDKDTDYTLRVSNGWGEARATVHVAVHAADENVAPHVAVGHPPARDLAIVSADGKDVVVDPPVRLWPQWDRRWASQILGGADDHHDVYWQKDGCTPSCATIILRWFAEDRKAVDFPVMQGSQIARDFYGPRMGQAFWPEGFQYYNNTAEAQKSGHKERPGNPDGKVSLFGKRGEVDFPDIFDYAAYWLRHRAMPPGDEGARKKAIAGSAYQPKQPWTLDTLRALLKVGPVILGLNSPAKHFVVAQGVRDGALLIVDPGGVLVQAMDGGRTHKSDANLNIASWKGMRSMTTLKVGTGKPPQSQWPGGPPGSEYSEGGYLAISGEILQALLGGLANVFSLSYPKLDSTGAAAAPPPAPAPAVQEAACAGCAALQKMGPAVAGKIEFGGKDKEAIALLQSHLREFGYKLGKSGPKGDGVDGDFGPATRKAVAAFMQEAGISGSAERLDEELVRRLVVLHAAQFVSKLLEPASELETFFKYSGLVGPDPSRIGNKHTYVAYRLPGDPPSDGKPKPWFMRGRYMVDFDGAANTYHPTKTNVLPLSDYQNADTWDGVLDSLKNAKTDDGKWAAVVLDANGEPIQRGGTGPFKDYYVSTTPLYRKDKTGADRYCDALTIPFFAMPTQILAEKGARFTRVATGATGDYGDYVTAINLIAPDKPYAHAIVGDAGDKPEFGEGSWALGKKIKFLTGADWAQVLYLVYPHTGAGKDSIPEAGDIQTKGEELFKAWGGMKKVEELLKLADLKGDGQ